MDALIPVVTRVRYNSYSNYPEQAELIVKLFLAIPDGDYTMAPLHGKAGVPITTLYPWREGTLELAIACEYNH
jgi:hypothetical protein